MGRPWLCPGRVKGLGSGRCRLTRLLELRVGLCAFIFIFKRLSKVCSYYSDTCSEDLCFSNIWGVGLVCLCHFNVSFLGLGPFLQARSHRPHPFVAELLQVLRNLQSTHPLPPGILYLEISKSWPAGKTWPRDEFCAAPMVF